MAVALENPHVGIPLKLCEDAREGQGTLRRDSFIRSWPDPCGISPMSKFGGAESPSNGAPMDATVVPAIGRNRNTAN